MWKIFKTMNQNLNLFRANKPNDLLSQLFSGISINHDGAVNRFSIESEESSRKPESKTTTTIQENPYYSKYAEKIKKAQALKNATTTTTTTDHDQQQQGQGIGGKVDQQITSKINTENDKTRLESEINSIKESVAKSSGQTKKSRKTLDEIVKLELFQDKSKDEIASIWNAYHSKRDCIYATIPSALYDGFYKNLKEYSSFILPLPRTTTDSKPNYEFFLMQTQDHCCYFTPLAAYHLHQEMAPPCLTIHYYPELSLTKGIVLMAGEFDSNIINIVECQCLANQLQYYYSTKEPAPRLSLHMFNKDPKNFDHMRLIQHLEQGFCSAPINLNEQD